MTEPMLWMALRRMLNTSRICVFKDSFVDLDNHLPRFDKHEIDSNTLADDVNEGQCSLILWRGCMSRNHDAETRASQPAGGLSWFVRLNDNRIDYSASSAGEPLPKSLP